MAKRSVLGWFDRGNQRAMDYVRSQPDAGMRFAPYAKSDSARRAALAIVIAVGLVAAIFGWLPGLIALIIAAPFLWRLEHHFFFGGRDADDVLPTNDEDSGRGAP
jgi:hypothetical protein